MSQRFAIFYADGTVVEGGGAGDDLVDLTIRVSRDWLEAPDDGVLFVAVDESATSRTIVRGGEYYYPFPEGEGAACADHLGAYLRGFLPGLVKIGQYVSGTRFVDALQQAKAWRDAG